VSRGVSKIFKISKGPEESIEICLPSLIHEYSCFFTFHQGDETFATASLCLTYLAPMQGRGQIAQIYFSRACHTPRKVDTLQQICALLVTRSGGQSRHS
jgi:hypothetical protein